MCRYCAKASLTLISEHFVFNFIVLSLNKKEVFNKWQRQDSTCDVYIYNFASGVTRELSARKTRIFSTRR